MATSHSGSPAPASAKPGAERRGCAHCDELLVDLAAIAVDVVAAVGRVADVDARVGVALPGLMMTRSCGGSGRNTRTPASHRHGGAVEGARLDARRRLRESRQAADGNASSRHEAEARVRMSLLHRVRDSLDQRTLPRARARLRRRIARRCLIAGLTAACPGRSGKPRRNSPAGHRPLAGALHLQHAHGARAAGDGERVVQHGARRCLAPSRELRCAAP